SEEVKKDTPTNKGKNKVLLKDKKDNERESEPKEKSEEASTSTHNKAQTYLNTKETLSLKECGTMDYGTLIIQEALSSNMSETAISKRKRDTNSSQEDANKHALTLTESIIQNSKRPKEDTTVTTQQNTEISIVPLKDEHSMIKTRQEDIYSSQWAFTRDEMELRSQWAQESTIIYMTKRIHKEEAYQTKPIPVQALNRKLESKNRAFPLPQEEKDLSQAHKENISQNDLLQEILERLNRLEISQSEKASKENWEHYQEDFHSFLFKRSSIKMLESDSGEAIKMLKTSKLIDSRTLRESNQIILEVNTKLDTQIQALS
ncbi:11582_t:CDS:2, partial [Gigaspora rosea]